MRVGRESEAPPDAARPRQKCGFILILFLFNSKIYCTHAPRDSSSGGHACRLNDCVRSGSARARAVPIDPTLSFAPEGLVMGAGTVLAPADAGRRLRPLKGQEARILALLSVAYGRAVGPSALGAIDRAAKCWRGGEDCLALIHLALAGLHSLEDRREGARRLFMADGLIRPASRQRSFCGRSISIPMLSTLSNCSMNPSRACRQAVVPPAASGCA